MDVVAGSALTSCCAGELRPVRRKAASNLLWRLADGDCLMGVQLGLMGVQLGGKVIWAGLRDCGCGAGTAGQQREAVTRDTRFGSSNVAWIFARSCNNRT